MKKNRSTVTVEIVLHYSIEIGSIVLRSGRSISAVPSVFQGLRAFIATAKVAFDIVMAIIDGLGGWGGFCFGIIGTLRRSLA